MKLLKYSLIVIFCVLIASNLTFSQTMSQPTPAKDASTYVFPVVGQYMLKIDDYPEITNSMLQIDSIDKNILKGKVEINLSGEDNQKPISGDIKGKISNKEVILFLVRFSENNNKKIIFKMKLTLDSSGYKIFKGKCKITEDGKKKIIKNVTATPLFQQPSAGIAPQFPIDKDIKD